MSSIAADLNKVLPAPKHAAVEDPLSSSSSSVPSSRILGAADLERQQLVLKVSLPPPRPTYAPCRADGLTGDAESGTTAVRAAGGVAAA